MKISIIFIFLLSLFVQMKGQQNTYTTFYELDFPVNKQLQKWKSQSALILSSDIGSNLENAVLRINRIYVKDTIPINDITGALQQTLLLPHGTFNMAEIFVTTKALNLVMARLRVSVLDEQEKVLFSDTISILKNAKWNTGVGQFPLQKAKLLFLSLEMEGSPHICPQSLWLDKIEIKLDGKNIDSYPISSLSPLHTFEKSNVIPLSFSNTLLYNNIPQLKDKQIIALGETAHGSTTINNVAFQFIKNQIVNNNCTLVLLEYPLEQILPFNRFIRGDNAYLLEHLMMDIESSSFSSEQMMDFIIWLRDYNKSAKEKVTLMGIDISSSFSRSIRSIFNYCYEINRKKQNLAIDTLCLNLLSTISGKKFSMQLLPAYSDVHNEMSANEYIILKHYLGMTFNLGDDQQRRYQARDSIMYENVTFFKKLLCQSNEKIVVYSHFEHINLKSTFPSLGVLLKNEYQDKYFSIGILINEGNCIFRRIDNIKRSIESLQPGIIGSIEFTLSKLKIPLLYIPIEYIPCQLIYMRNIGNLYLKDQFSILNLCGRLNGIIFINKDEVITKDTLIDGKDEKELLQKNIEKQNDLKRKVEEIKSRFAKIKKECLH